MRLNILAFAAGVLLLQMQPELPPAGLWALGGGLAILPRCRWSGRTARLLAILGCCALGLAWAGWRAELRLAEQLPDEWEDREVEVVGVIAGLPQDFSNGTRFEFVREITLTPAAVVPERLMLSWYQGRRDGEAFERLPVRPGERWRFTVRVKRPHGTANPHGFDYEAWLLERDIRATGYIRPNPPQRLSAMVWRPDYLIERLRHGVRARYAAMLPPESHPWSGILVALAVGDQKAIQGDLWTTFNRTGTTHLMSISGLHVTMVAALFGWLVGFGWRRVPRLALALPAQKAGLLAACGAALIYALLPALRYRPAHALHAAGRRTGHAFRAHHRHPRRRCCSACGVLWSTLGGDGGRLLAVVRGGRRLALRRLRRGRPGPGLARRLHTWGVVQWAATRRRCRSCCWSSSNSRWFRHGQRGGDPVVSFIVTPLALSRRCFLGADRGAGPRGDGLVMLSLIGVPPAGLAGAGATSRVAVAAGLGVAICLLPRGLPGRMLGLFLIGPALFWPVTRPAEGEAWITVLDVGQGLASVVRTRDHTLIYDPGPLYSAESDAGQRVVVPYLRQLGIDRVDLLMVTHRDSDHAGGTASVTSALTVGAIRSSLPEIAGEPCLAGQGWTWDGVLFEVLHPAPEQAAAHQKTNHQSCVLRVTAGGKSMLLTSDIEASDEAALLERYPGQLAADVLLVPHHGSRTSSTPAFLKAVAPGAAVIPVGYRNRFGHPKSDVLERYAGLGLAPWRTDRDGAVDVRLAAEGLALSGWRGEYRRYWQGK